MDRIWLSLDYDFFVREDAMWDWGHVESPFFRSSMIWLSRAAGLMSHGLNYCATTREGTTTHEDFLAKLFSLTVSPAVDFVVADSHSLAYRYFMDSKGSVDRLLHFDAHHDLGYSPEAVRAIFNRRTVACDNWLYALMLQRQKMPVQIVYPDWRGIGEWSESAGADERNRRLLRSAILPPTTFKDLVLKGGEVTKVFLCKSSSWTPPWHDADFIRFAHAVGEWLKVEPRAPYRLIEGGYDPLVPREWDEVAVASMADFWKGKTDALRSRPVAGP